LLAVQLYGLKQMQKSYTNKPEYVEVVITLHAQKPLYEDTKKLKIFVQERLWPKLEVIDMNVSIKDVYPIIS